MVSSFITTWLSLSSLIYCHIGLSTAFIVVNNNNNNNDLAGVRSLSSPVQSQYSVDTRRNRVESIDNDAWTTTILHRRRRMFQHYSEMTSSNDHKNDDDDYVYVALTREEGKNDKLRDSILNNHPSLASQIKLVELPCIEHASGPDYDQLSSTLVTEEWDYVVVTSPEAAKVLSSAWPDEFRSTTEDDSSSSSSSRKQPPLVAAVGKATEKSLKDVGIDVSFCPSKATAATLAVELEPIHNNNKDETTRTTTKVLYPASARAQRTLEDGLSNRGCFTVTRLNTYDTVTANWDPSQRDTAINKVDIVCFASPSSVKGWLHNTKDHHRDVLAACIGETSATACRNLGWDDDQILYPNSPGIDGWITSIEQATGMTMEHRTSTTSLSSSSSQTIHT